MGFFMCVEWLADLTVFWWVWESGGQGADCGVAAQGWQAGGLLVAGGPGGQATWPSLKVCVCGGGAQLAPLLQAGSVVRGWHLGGGVDPGMDALPKRL